ncbi:MAG: cytochrome C, partial [Planctomycetota bacterium]
SGKWPSYYEDSLPPVVEIGPGSPTGVVSAEGAKFPTRYQDAIFALDWTFGTIYAVHLQPDGAGYTGVAEHFVYSTPLPVTDAVIVNGDLIFTVGGRGTQSAMFRVSYVGHEPTDTPKSVDKLAAAAREKRQSLEQYHAHQDDAAVAAAWPELNNEDRFIRYAARVALESQPVDSWSSKVYKEPDPRSRIVATIALARSGTSSHRKSAIKGLLALPAESLQESDQLKLLRAYALTFLRLGRPTELEREAIVAQIDPLLPSKSGDVNTELIRVLTYLQAPSVIAKAMQLIREAKEPELPDWGELATRNANYGGTVLQMLNNHPPTREIGYAFILRNMRSGWTLGERRSYFEFLNRAAKASGGASYTGYLQRLRDEALGNCSNEERAALENVTGENFNPTPDFAVSAPKGPGQMWTLEKAIEAARAKPNFENGRSLYFSVKCGNCHRLRGLGGNIGPDLTSVPNKFDSRYVVQAIVEPSKDISDQYGSSVVLLEDGRILTGLTVNDGENITVYPMNPDERPITVPRAEVDAIRNSKVSQMPMELLNSLNAQEIADLVGYVMAGGDAGKIRK